MQARYYDPVIGRFLANDPVGFSPQRSDMFNRYAYAGNDPVNAIDATGESPLAIMPVIRAIRIAGGAAGIASGGRSSALGSPALQYHYSVVGGGSCACIAIPFDGSLAPPAASDGGSVDKAGNWTTEGGSVVRNHGKKGTGEAYAAGKHWSGDQIDDAVNNPDFVDPGKKDRYTNQDTQVKTKDGEWLQQNEDGEVIAMGQRGFGDEPPIKDPEE